MCWFAPESLDKLIKSREDPAILGKAGHLDSVGAYSSSRWQIPINTARTVTITSAVLAVLPAAVR
jgi:hypothetical protein